MSYWDSNPNVKWWGELAYLIFPLAAMFALGLLAVLIDWLVGGFES